MRATRRVLAIAGLALALLVGPAFGAAANAQPSVIGGKVKIVDFAFMPASITIPIHTAVRWTNRGSTTHTTTSDTAGIFDSGPLAPAAAFQHKFNTAGTFTYHCVIHTFMTGTVVVTA